MQVKSHHMQDLQLVGFFVNMGSFRFCFALSTRAHGVPFLHTSGAHLTTPFHGAIAVGAMLPPYTPLLTFSPAGLLAYLECFCTFAGR